MTATQKNSTNGTGETIERYRVLHSSSNSKIGETPQPYGISGFENVRE